MEQNIKKPPRQRWLIRLLQGDYTMKIRLNEEFYIELFSAVKERFHLYREANNRALNIGKFRNINEALQVTDELLVAEANQREIGFYEYTYLVRNKYLELCEGVVDVGGNYA